MKKIAIFVEGHTEAFFVKTLIEALIGKNNVAISEEIFHGNGFIVKYKTHAASQQCEVLIANCCCDGKVNSAIRDRYDNLVNAGYTYIIGLRDIYPIPSEELKNFIHGMKPYLPIGAAPVNIVIAVSEIESWFIEEETHFLRIDKKLTRKEIIDNFDYDILSGESEKIVHPSTLLNEIYSISNKAYKKKQKQIQRTVNALDMDNLYLNSQNRSNSLKILINQIENSLF